MMTTTLLDWVAANWPVLILATIATIALAAFLRPGESARGGADFTISLSAYQHGDRDSDGGDGDGGGGGD